MDVNDFMARLTASAAPAGKGARAFTERQYLEKVSLNFAGNFGNYQLFPVNSEVIDYPFVVLHGTREVCIPRKRTAQDGTEETYSVWIKLLPKSAYVMKDLNGRLTSSLTADDESVLSAACTLWDQLNDELTKEAVTEEQKVVAYNIKKNLIRKRNYTIFHAYCLNKWDMGNTKSPVRNNFSGLFVSTASSFNSSLKSDVDQKSLMYGGSVDFIKDIYSSSATGRTGSLFMTVNRPQGQTTYDVQFSHVPNDPKLASIEIPAADFKLMKDPLETFLGWQAGREGGNESIPVGQRRLFNANLIREAISFMQRQLAAVRMAKQNNSDVLAAIDATTAAALAEIPAPSTVTTRDPMLATSTGTSAAEYNAEKDRIEVNNTDPYMTPPAARMDPVSGNPVSAAPVNNGFTSAPEPTPVSAPFAAPQFGQPFNPGFGSAGTTAAPDTNLPF